MTPDSDVEYLLALLDHEYPDPVDQFEDLLCEMLGIYRHPTTSLDEWRGHRVQAIEGAGDEVDRLARLPGSFSLKVLSGKADHPSRTRPLFLPK